MPISQNKKIIYIRIFLYSFLILFLELSLIRFIPANIRLIGYFANVILLATFLGMGCGMILAKKNYSLLELFPYLIGALLIIIAVFKIEINLSSPDAIFFSAVSENFVGLEPNIVLPMIFIFVTLINIPLAQGLGQLFGLLTPLEAYTHDIIGSVAGIVLFTGLSFLSAPPVIWFFVVFGIYTYLAARKTKLFIVGGIICIGCLGLIISTDHGSIWSPYYRITVTPIHDGIPFDERIAIAVNNIPHQYMSHFNLREPFYYLPYHLFRNQQFKKILIIGAGSGADTATALGMRPTVEHIDAVEIDPAIASLGKQLNPDKPFSNPKVTLHIDDGRNFLQNSHEKYDLIIYALTDSLALAAKSANIRLESFIFTKESFQLVKDHLTDNGLFTLYNYYREKWLVDKLATMTTSVFGYTPIVVPFGTDRTAAVIMTGPKIHDLSENLAPEAYMPKEDILPSTDDWPFLYLKSRTIPPVYRSFIALLAVLSIILVVVVSGGIKHVKINLQFFCFGAGFLLLETKSLATFALLFGTTWLVNSLVFASLLLFVLLAIWVNTKYQIKNITLWYASLFFMLIAQLLVPTSWFLGLSFGVRLIGASIFFVSPIFFANILFAHQFKESDEPQEAFGINLLGALFGGFLEYLSLAFGYRSLTILVIALYAIALCYKKLSLFTRRSS